MIDEQSPASGHDYASNRSAIGAGPDKEGTASETANPAETIIVYIS